MDKGLLRIIDGWLGDEGPVSASMNGWNAEKFYQENSQSAASFFIGTMPTPTNLRCQLAVILSQILRENLRPYGWRGTVHTPHGDFELVPEYRSELLCIQARVDAERNGD